MKRKVRLVISFLAAAVMLITQSMTIKAVEPDDEKTLLNPYELVQTEIMENGGGFYEGDISYSPIAGSKILKAENVDFSKGLTGIEVTARTRWGGSEIYVYIDDPKSDPIARILIRAYSFSTCIGIPMTNVSGVHDIYFEANNPIDITTWKALPGKMYEGGDVPQIDPYKDNEAEVNFGTSGVGVVTDKRRTVLAGFSENDFFLMKDVNFEKGLKSITIEARAEDDGIIEVRKDSLSGELIGTIEFRDTDDSYKPFEGEMANIEGMQKIYFVGKKGKCNIDNWRAAPRNTDGPLPVPGEKISPYGYIEAELDFPGENAEIIEDTWNKVVSIKENGYISVQKVNFKYGLSSIVIFAKADEPAAVEIREGAVDGELLGVIKLDKSEGEYEYYSTKAPNTEGIHNLFFVCKVGSCRIDKWMAMSKMMPVPGNEPISHGEEGDDPEKEHTELPEEPEKPEIPEEPEKPDLPEIPEKPEEPEQPDIQGDCKLELTYSRDIWGSGYQINFKITNKSEEQTSGWLLKIKKKYINVAQSWCVNVDEDDEYYVFTPLSWNSSLNPGQSTEFGIIGNGDASGGLDYFFSDKNN